MPRESSAQTKADSRAFKKSLKNFSKNLLGSWRLRNKAFWSNIVPDLLRQELESPRVFIPQKERLRLWLLVLEAKRIPYIVLKNRGRTAVFIPPLEREVALWEIVAFEREKSGSYLLPASTHAWEGTLILALALFVFHAVRWRWFSFLDFSFLPAGEKWPQAFGLDVYRTTNWGQWWRPVTALWIHGGLQHLLSNLVFTSLFVAMLSRRTGFYKAFFLALVGGVLGNTFNVFYKPMSSLSIGFSTASFAALGALTAYGMGDRLLEPVNINLSLRERLRPLLVPLGAGLAMLAFIGGAGRAQTDFSAHVFGLLAGFILGFALWLMDRELEKYPLSLKDSVSKLFFFFAVYLSVFAWIFALDSI